MAESGSETRTFTVSALSSVAGSLLLSGATALWQHLHGHSIDWYGILALFVLAAIAFISLLWIVRRSNRALPEQSSEPKWKSGEHWRGLYVAECAKATKLEQEVSRQLGVCEQLKSEKRDLYGEIDALKKNIVPMSPHRAELLALIDELSCFRKKIPQFPDGDRQRLTSTGGITDAYLADRAQKINLWTSAIGHEYAERFSPRVTALTHSLGAGHLDVRQLEKYSGWVGTPNDVDGAISSLQDLVWKVE